MTSIDDIDLDLSKITDKNELLIGWGAIEKYLSLSEITLKRYERKLKAPAIVRGGKGHIVYTTKTLILGWLAELKNKKKEA